jgi:hypothetical protein
MKFDLRLKLPTAPPAPIPQPSELELAAALVEDSERVLQQIEDEYRLLQEKHQLVVDSLGRIQFLAVADPAERRPIEMKVRELIERHYAALGVFGQRLREHAGQKMEASKNGASN